MQLEKSEFTPFCVTQDLIFWYILLITLNHFPFIPLLIIFVNSPLLLTLSNALLKSTNVQNSFFLCRKYKSINDFKIKMLSNVECIFLKPACEGEIRLTSSANEFNRLFNILVKTLLKQLSRLIGL